MDLLSQIRQDSAAFLATPSPAAETVSPPIVVAIPPKPSKPPIPRPSLAELHLPTSPWWLEIAAVPGDAMYGPLSATGERGAHVQPHDAPPSSLAASGLDVPDQQPRATPTPCFECGCPLAWEDLARACHCCECRPIPGRRMVRGLWRLAVAPLPSSPDGTWPLPSVACWARYRPTYWDPLGHLVSAECDAAAKESDGF